MAVKYLPFEQRRPDWQYRLLLRHILTEGQCVDSQQEEEATMVFGHQMRFPLANGFPLITERDLSGPFLHQGMGELFAFVNGAHTQSQLEQFGCRWWNRWATSEKCAKRGLEPGDLGQGSYGAAWTAFPTEAVQHESGNYFPGQPFDQIQHLVEQIQELPHLRTHIVTPFIPQYLGRGKGKTQKVVVVPCHGFFHVLVNTRTNELAMHHFQRSADVPVGLVFSMVNYALLTLMLAQVTGYTAKELVFTLSDAHMFARQHEAVQELLTRQPRCFPTVTLDPSITDLRAFRQEHVHITDYYPHPKMVIGTPV